MRVCMILGDEAMVARIVLHTTLFTNAAVVQIDVKHTDQYLYRQI